MGPGMPFPSLKMTLSGHHRPYRRGIPTHFLGFRPEAGYTKRGSEESSGPPRKSLSTLPTCGKGGSYEDEVRTTTSAERLGKNPNAPLFYTASADRLGKNPNALLSYTA